ncbi:MAG TPA: hypothetical protein VEC11_13870 [Allosphingosinicella sp.]|nr:hypothetical protein [Allosphingosinicella sp.]
MAGQMTGGRSFNFWRVAGWGLATALLATPLVAMQFTDEVRWGPLDFAVAALLIGGLGGALEFAVRRSGNACYRLGAALAAFTAFLLIWVNLAVGFIGEPHNPANLMFAGVLLVALAGAVAARFRPRGMMLAMAAAAIAQLLIAVAVFVAALGRPLELFLTIAFAMPWLLAAGLFQRAAETDA